MKVIGPREKLVEPQSTRRMQLLQVETAEDKRLVDGLKPRLAPELSEFLEDRSEYPVQAFLRLLTIIRALPDAPRNQNREEALA